MIEKTVYIASNGMQFDDKEKCRSYELNINPTLPKFYANEVTFYNKKGSCLADLSNTSFDWNWLDKHWTEIYFIRVTSHAFERFRKWMNTIEEKKGYNLPYDCSVSYETLDDGVIWYYNESDEWVCVQDKYRELWFTLNKLGIFSLNKERTEKND